MNPFCINNYSGQDYYPFGMVMPGRKFSTGSSYRYGFNGQERSTEVNDDSYAAEFWQYDSRIGRRWNIDPRPTVGISPLSVFNNNPIFYTDVLGDTSVVGAGGAMNVEIDDNSNTLEFYKSSSNVITGTSTKTPSQAGQLRSFTNVLGTFTARWTTDASGAAVFAGYLNDKNQTVETSLKELNEFASSKLGRLWLWASNHLEQDLKDINNDPIGHNLKIGFAMISMSAMASVEPVMYGRSSNSSTTTLENMSGLGGFVRPSALPNGSFYSVAFETSIPSSLHPGGSYWNHFKAANTNLNSAMVSDASFANSMKALGIKIPTSSRGIQGVSPQNWVWHHDVKTGILQLVPKSQHPNNFGGIFWNTLHPNGSGGNALWNK